MNKQQYWPVIYQQHTTEKNHYSQHEHCIVDRLSMEKIYKFQSQFRHWQQIKEQQNLAQNNNLITQIEG